MAARSRSRNKLYLADVVRNELRHMILLQEYPAGFILTDRKIVSDLQSRSAEKFAELSVSPVREALIALEAEDLVEILPRVGTRVRGVDKEDAKGLLYNRFAIEEFIASQLASMRPEMVDLTASQNANAKLKTLAEKYKNPDATIDAPNDEETINAHDADFHEGLARAAGFPKLADELSRLRDRTRFFSRARMKLTRAIVEGYVAEHKAILEALRWDDGVRPDVNEVRNAIRRHLKKSADRWDLAPDASARGKRYYDRDVLADIPDLPPSDSSDSEKGSVEFDLLAARVTTELLGLKRLALRPTIPLDAARNINDEMSGIADEAEAKANLNDEDKRKIKTKFVNADIGFHSALMFLTGLQFAEELVVHFWRRFYRIAWKSLDLTHLREVVSEHDDLLAALRPRRRQSGDVQKVAAVYLDHVSKALARHGRKDQPIGKRFAQLVDVLRAGSDSQ